MLRTLRRSRLQSLTGILAAILLAALSLLHQHALIPEHNTPTPCTVCAFGADVTVVAPEPVAPDELAYELPAVSEAPLASACIIALPARAPPAA
jgi:predicted membrane-bound mannosyltransferase